MAGCCVRFSGFGFRRRVVRVLARISIRKPDSLFVSSDRLLPRLLVRRRKLSAHFVYYPTSFSRRALRHTPNRSCTTIYTAVIQRKRLLLFSKCHRQRAGLIDRTTQHEGCCAPLLLVRLLRILAVTGEIAERSRSARRAVMNSRKSFPADTMSCSIPVIVETADDSEWIQRRWTTTRRAPTPTTRPCQLLNGRPGGQNWQITRDFRRFLLARGLPLSLYAYFLPFVLSSFFFFFSIYRSLA